MIYTELMNQRFQNTFILIICYLNTNQMPMMKNLADFMMNPMSSEASTLSTHKSNTKKNKSKQI